MRRDLLPCFGPRTQWAYAQGRAGIECCPDLPLRSQAEKFRVNDIADGLRDVDRALRVLRDHVLRAPDADQFGPLAIYGVVGTLADTTEVARTLLVSVCRRLEQLQQGDRLRHDVTRDPADASAALASLNQVMLTLGTSERGLDSAHSEISHFYIEPPLPEA